MNHYVCFLAFYVFFVLRFSSCLFKGCDNFFHNFENSKVCYRLMSNAPTMCDEQDETHVPPLVNFEMKGRTGTSALSGLSVRILDANSCIWRVRKSTHFFQVCISRVSVTLTIISISSKSFLPTCSSIRII